MPSKTESAGAASKVMLVNRRRQPVELHFGDATRVLLPGQRLQVQPEQLKLPQIAFLIGRRAISVAEERLPAAPAAEEHPPASEAAGPETSEAAEAEQPTVAGEPAEPSPQKGRAARSSAAEPKRPASPTKGKPA